MMSLGQDSCDLCIGVSHTRVFGKGVYMSPSLAMIFVLARLLSLAEPTLAVFVH